MDAARRQPAERARALDRGGARRPACASRRSLAFATVGADGPTLLADGEPQAALSPTRSLFTTALWTRKAREVEANPNVALLFHWPTLGRQAHLTGAAALAERALAEELFAERDLLHQLQTVVSRQGEPIEDLDPLRERLAHLAAVQETAPRCPPDWGALRVRPDSVELWSRSRPIASTSGAYSSARARAGG